MTRATGAGERADEIGLVLSEPVPKPADGDFDAVFLEHYPRLVGVIARVVNDRSRAEHLAADVFWKLFRKPPKHDRGSVGGWLYRTAVRTALDALRVGSRRIRHESAAAGHVHPDRPADPLADLILEERRAKVRLTLAKMKRRQAQMLLLRASGLSYQDIADALKINPRSVGTLLARAEDQFESRYRAAYGNED